MQFESSLGIYSLLDEDRSAEAGFEFRKEIVKFLKKRIDFPKPVIEENLFLLTFKKAKIVIEFDEEDIEEFKKELDGE